MRSTTNTSKKRKTGVHANSKVFPSNLESTVANKGLPNIKPLFSTMTDAKLRKRLWYGYLATVRNASVKKLEIYNNQIISRFKKQIGCEAGTIFYLDENSKMTDNVKKHKRQNNNRRFMFFINGKSYSMKTNKGLVGACFETMSAIRVDDAYADKRFNRDIDIATNFRTYNIVCVPIFKHDDEMFGVVEMINKRANVGKGEPMPFTDIDVNYLVHCCTQISRTLSEKAWYLTETTQLLNMIQ